MTLEKAFARVAELYAVYIQNPDIENPIAVALWQVSMEAEEEEQQKKQKKRGVCKDCAYFHEQELSDFVKESGLAKWLNVTTRKTCTFIDGLDVSVYGKGCRMWNKRYDSVEEIMKIVNTEERKRAILNNQHLFRNNNS